MHSDPPPTKVAIPRLLPKRPEPPKKASISRVPRVERACLSCRARKIRCNAAIPKCANCSQTTASCVYVSSRRDKLKIAKGHNEDMVALLRHLRGQVSSASKSRIDEMLATVTDDVVQIATSVHEPLEKLDQAGVIREDEPEASNVRVGVPTFTESGLQMGVAIQIAESAAKSSQVPPRWPRSCPSICCHPPKPPLFLDDELLETDLEVDPFEIPPFDDAEKLFKAYVRSCHNSFPLLAKKVFTQQFYHYYAAVRRGESYEPPHTWQAQLQVVLAIGAFYLHLTSDERCANSRHHLVYHSRAWVLSLRCQWWFSQPGLPQMQIAGLLSFYYFSTGHIDRSWAFIGIALRFGYALGLNIQNTDPASSSVTKEVLSRIWWGHFSLETLLAVTTGRVSNSPYGLCSVALPLPLPSADIEEAIIESRFGARETIFTSRSARKASPLPSESMNSAMGTRVSCSISSSEPVNSGSYLKNVIKLGEITNAVFQLYTPGTIHASWSAVQAQVVRMIEDLDYWAASLPDGLDFVKNRAFYGQTYEREKNALAILFHGTKILITRPCLCRLDRRSMAHVARSNGFNERLALTCVESAKSVARLLPSHPNFDTVRLYEAFPWWNIVHVIMQSLTVLLLELMYGARDSFAEGQEILSSLKELARWLQAMGFKNVMAKRAYSRVLRLLRASVSKINMDISDLLREDDRLNGAGTTAGAYDDVTELGHSSASSTPIIAHAHIQRSYAQDRCSHSSSPTGAGRFSPDASFQAASHPTLSMEGPQMAIHDASRSIFPTLIFTTFDEQNPLANYGMAEMDIGVA